MTVYRGVNNVARKVTKQYRGVGNVARKITKEYRGVDNVARKVFSSDLVIYERGVLYIPLKIDNIVIDSSKPTWWKDGYLYLGGNSGSGNSIKTVNALSVDGYNTINFEVYREDKQIAGYDYPGLDMASVGSNSSPTDKRLTTATTTGYYTWSFKFPDFSGSGILQFKLMMADSTWSGGQGFSGNIYKIWLSKT